MQVKKSKLAHSLGLNYTAMQIEALSRKRPASKAGKCIIHGLKILIDYLANQVCIKIPKHLTYLTKNFVDQSFQIAQTRRKPNPRNNCSTASSHCRQVRSKLRETSNPPKL